MTSPEEKNSFLRNKWSRLRERWKQLFTGFSKEQGILFSTGALLVVIGIFIGIKSDTAVVLGALLLTVAAFDPATIKSITGKHFGMERYEPTEDQKEIIFKNTQKDPSPEVKEKAKKLVEEAETRPEAKKSPWDYLVLAENFLVEKNYDKSLEKAFLGLQLNPEGRKIRAYLLVTIGNVYRETKAFALASKFTNQALQLLPEDPNMQINHGVLLIDQEKYDDALKAFEEALSLNPQDYLAQYNLAVCLDRMNRKDDAFNEYQKVLEKKPDYAQAYFGLGAISLIQKRFHDAEGFIQKAIDLDPKYADAHSQLGLAKYLLKQFDESDHSYKKALELEPDNLHANANYGFLLFEEEKFEKSLKQFEKAISLKGNDPDDFAGKAISLAKLNRQEEALETYKKAAYLNNDFLNAETLKEDYFWTEKQLAAARPLIEAVIAERNQ